MTAVRPLTHRGANGELYYRRPEVERQIETVVSLPVPAVLERTRISNKDDPEYLKDECLVYLIREHRRAGESTLVSDLCEQLLRRCYGIVYSCVGKLRAEFAEEAHAEVVEQLFRKILNTDSDRGDYYEVSFGDGLKRLALTAFGKYSHKQNATDQNVDWDQFPGHDPGLDDAEAPVASALRAADRSAALEALRTLGEPYRTAFYLRYYRGWPTEAADPGKPSLSRYFNKTPKTIFNWFTHAEKKLVIWREGQQ
ncbi:MAG: hypothetical protein ACR2PL_16965 [Dehalococcoidia bacterium]